VVLDANILLRGVWGSKVRSLLEMYESNIAFYSPDVCFDDARRYIPYLAEQRHLDATAGLSVLDQLEQMVQRVDLDLYDSHEETARKRMASRDVEDWPILAAAIIVPSGQKTATFFGSGVATWTTANIELYFKGF